MAVMPFAKEHRIDIALGTGDGRLVVLDQDFTPRAAGLAGGPVRLVRAVTDGLRLPQAPPDPNLRARLAARIADEGAATLHAELAAIDPEGAAGIDPRNQRRLIRALEVTLTTGLPFSQLGRVEPPLRQVLSIGLTTDRADLYRRIDERVEQQIADGLVDEARRLHDAGYGWELPAMSSLGYRQIGEHLRGECDLPTAIRRIKTQTHRFARQQYAWFRLADVRLHWLDVRSDAASRAKLLVERWLHSQ